jgi:LysM repeat protein
LIAFLLASVHLYNVKPEEALHSNAAIFSEEDNYFLHTVERGQTVYSISKMYNVTIEEIYELNLGSEEGIKAGATLKIPQNSGSYFYHTIQPQETLYSVSRKYQMKGEDILNVNQGLSIETFIIGKIIRIPTNKVTTPMEGDENYNQILTNSLLYPSLKTEKIKTIRMALLLPIGLKEGTTPKNAANNRMVEYYEGFLLALEEVKKKGISVDLQVHDIGSGIDILPGLLKMPSMQDVHIIIGGLSNKQISMISDFSNERNILYVIPFSKNEEPLSHNVYQINMPSSYLYSKVSSAFCNKYKDSNIIFYNLGSSKNRTDFVEMVKKDLNAKKIPYKVVETTKNLLADISRALDERKSNVIVPEDDGAESLTKLIVSLKSILETKSQIPVSLFGYPTWQVYSAQHSEDFFRLNAIFFSIYYANPASSKVKSFHSNYQNWYSRDLINTFPKYGMLGYDTGMFFIQLLHKYGTAYETNANKLSYEGVQTDFYFERLNNWSGFINANIFLIEFSSDSNIVTKHIK